MCFSVFKDYFSLMDAATSVKLLKKIVPVFWTVKNILYFV